MLIFVLQAIWLYIKELAGKDLDVVTILKFLMYITPTLIPLILPLTILLSSIMVFGNFAENYEFAAMKSTGISLQRAMTGLSVFIVGLSLLTFFFSNNVIPWAQFESHNLRRNIAKIKPSMAIAEGQFNDVGDNFNIKVEEKSGENGKDLKGVIIHQKSNKGVNGNHTVIVAKTGELASAKDSDVLKLILFNGYYYDDTPPKKYDDRKKKPFVKSEFKKHVMSIDLSQLNNIDLDERNVTDNYKMLNIKELDYTIDSLKNNRINYTKEFASSLYSRTNLETLNLTIKPKKDSIYNGELLDIYNLKRKIQILDYAINNVKSTQQIITSKEKTYQFSNANINRHGVVLHKKFALAAACFILFFVGAPLGALIRKGGLGLPMILAIVLFLSYHFIGLFAENSAKNGDLNPAFAAWFSTIIMFPLSIYLTTRATKDRGIFEFDHITQPIKEWCINRFASKEVLIDNETTSNLNADSSCSLNTEASVSSTVINTKLKSDYSTLSKLSMVFFSIALVLFLLYFVLKNNKLPQIATAGIQISIVSYIVFLFNYIKATLSFSKIVSALSLNKNPLLFVIGLILYPITHFKRRQKINF